MTDSPLISVCIPVYNSDVIYLVENLANQSYNLTNKVEIIVIDDSSNLDWKLKNKSIKKNCNYIELKENIGRSRIRNLFLNHTKGNFLLFIDGDSEIISSDYLLNYIQFLEREKVHVLVGGSVYQNEIPPRKYRLRWKYSILRESKTAEDRKASHFGFKTNNFLIAKNLFEKIQFNEEMQGYGHEDTFFGIQLKRENAIIDHIENPVLNRHLDSNEGYLKKTENAILNLAKLYALKTQFPEISQIRLIHFYEQLSKFKLIWLLSLVDLALNPILRKFLQKGFFALWMFDFYKLGLFIRKIKL